jgi:hypothetical protein
MGRRDKAIIDLFRATGIRLSEPAGIVYEPDKGGNEGDLMEPNGWSSPQMLRRYGASAPQRPSTLHLRPHHGRSIASITNRGAAVLCGPPEPHRRKGQIAATPDKLPLDRAKERASTSTSFRHSIFCRRMRLSLCSST